MINLSPALHVVDDDVLLRIPLQSAFDPASAIIEQLQAFLAGGFERRLLVYLTH